MNKEKILRSALILMFSLLFIKILGAVYKIVLINIIGSQGIGLYQLVFPVYAFMLVFSTAGVPNMISKNISEVEKENKLFVFNNLLKKFTKISITLSIILSVVAFPIAWLQGNIKLGFCYIILSPCILIVSLIAVFRGYYQGLDDFKPTAVSQIMEQVVKIVVGLVASIFFIKVSLMLSVYMLVFAILISEIISFLYLKIKYNRHLKKINSNFSTIKYQKDLSNIDKKNYISNNLINNKLNGNSRSILFSAMLIPFCNFIDSVLVINLLKVNIDYSFALDLFGLYNGIVLSIIYISSIFGVSIANVLLPSLTEEFKKKSSLSLDKLIDLIKILYVIAIPLVIGIIIFGDKIILTVFNSSDEFAVLMLKLSAINVFNIIMYEVTACILQSINKANKNLLNLSIGVFFKFLIEIILVLNPEINILGLVISNVLLYSFTMMANLIDLNKSLNLKIESYFFIKLFLINSIIFFVLTALNLYSNSLVYFWITTLFSAILYFLFIYLFKLIDLKKFKFKVKTQD